MDLRYPPEAEEFRGSVRDFLSKHVPDGWQGMGALPVAQQAEFLADWRRRLHENGLLAVSWPTEYGGAGRSAVEQLIIAEEFTAAGVPQGGPNDNFGIQMLGSTLLRFGTEEQRRHYLPRVLSQEDVWCQGFSEPEAGSDLAGIRTRARLEGDRWVIDGQKTWTSYAHLASHIFLLCRTEAGSQRNRGLSLLIVALDQPGVEVRPLRTMTGDVDFNEVFFTGAECPVGNVIGEVGAGWAAAIRMLGHERVAIGDRIRPRDYAASYASLAAAAGDDPAVRRRLAQLYVTERVTELFATRLGQEARAGRAPGPRGSVGKLAGARLARLSVDVAVEAVGPAALAWETGDADAERLAYAINDAPSTRIAGGTDEIQRGIIADRVLGLPREPAADKDVPFSEIKKGGRG